MRRALAVIPAVALVAAIGVGGLTRAPLAVSPGGGAPQVYTTGDSGELVTTLPVTRSPGPYGRAVIYCLDLGDVPAAGEVLSVAADLEVTNDLNMNVNVETTVLLSSSCAGTDGTEIVEANGTNCIPAQHHCSPVRAGALVVPADNTYRCVVLVAYAQASYATTGVSTLRVEHDYGRMSVLRWR